MMILMILREGTADTGANPRGRWGSLTLIGTAVYRPVMNPVTTIEGRAYPFGRKNVDTDVIIPAKWLKTVTRAGLSKGAFETVRAEAGNVFDDPAYAGASIIIAGDNFGCGSSREHAAWALDDMGVKAVIAPSFSDIFSGNAFKNGILTVVLPQAEIDRLMAVAKTDPIHLDLEAQTVTTQFQDRFTFEIDPFRKSCLLSGTDEIGLTLASADKIAEYERRAGGVRPWSQVENAA
jgi:3-isopropylmalate/(R)-2-methylmalate dehydratase small subunit